MNNFLYFIAKQIYDENSNNLNNICIVFPNNRAALFFNKYLIQIADKTVWTPKYTTINNFISDLSDYTLGDDISLIFELYKVYKKNLSSVESFDSFYYLGKMILNDFNDIDKNYLSAKDIYKNLKDIKEIENYFDYLTEDQKQVINKFWINFYKNKDSDQKSNFASIWGKLYNIYDDFNKVVKNKGEVYEGVIYKQLYDKIVSNSNLEINYEKIIFVGLNALNVTEQKLLDYLQKKNKAQFYWDADKYYFENEIFEAGNFIRENSKKFTPKLPLTDSIFNNFSKDKNIDVYSVSSNTGQSKIIGNILTKLANDKFDEENTAIVLADEELLIPVLNSIPNFIKNINITMGYPIKNTQSIGLVTNILKLWKESKLEDNERVFYYKNILSVLNHNLLKSNSTEINNFNDYIIDNNLIYIKSSNINFKSEALKFVFNNDLNNTELISNLILFIKNLLETIYQNNETTNKIEKEILFNIYFTLNRLNEVIEKEKFKFDKIQTYISLINSVLNGLSIPFEGEPLRGIQVMGILETRVLDFENVIILSSNEGVLPKISVASSFIPYNLRKGFGLPTIENQDSIFSYYFYRLIQRAKNISLVYNSEQSYTNTGEVSRFVKQLEYESGKQINYYNVENNISYDKKNKISVAKNQVVINILNEYFTNNQKYLSPSAINTYLDCELKFYFNYVSKLKEPKEFIEEIDSATFGTLFHKSMELIYNPFLNKIVSKDDITEIIKSKAFIINIKTAFENEKIKIQKQAVITFEVIKENVLQTLQKDLVYAPFKILNLEKDFKKIIDLNFNNSTKQIVIKGNIDRVDEQNGLIRIIDYKTGKAEQKTPDILSLFDSEIEKRPKAIFQTMIYAMAYKSEKKSTNIIPSVYQIKELYKEDFDYRLFIDKDVLLFDNYEKEFIEVLKNTINKIFDPKNAFKQTSITSNCKYCNYKNFCY